MLASIFLSFLLLFQATGVMPRTSETPRAAEPVSVKDEPPVVTKHSTRVGSRTLNYTVTTGFRPIKNDRTGDVEARLFYMAYTLDCVSDPRSRPLMFSLNGGAGSQDGR